MSTSSPAPAPLPLFIVLVFSLLAGCASRGGPSDRVRSGDDLSVSGAYLQGRFAAQDFNLPRADEAFEAVARRRDSTASKRMAFAYAVAAGSMEEAERQARLIIGQPGPEAEGFQPGLQRDLPRLTLAAAAMRDGDARQAEAWLDDPMASSLGRSLAVLLKSAAAFESRGLDAATAIVTDQEKGTFRGLVPLHVAALFELAGDSSAAEVAYRQALGAPRSEIAALAFGRFLEDQGRGDDAEAIYRRMVETAGLYSRAGRMGLVRIGALEPESRAFRRRAERQPRIFDDAASLFALALENYAWLGFEQGAGVSTDGPGGEQSRREALVVPLALANIARDMGRDRDVADYIAALVFGLYDTPDAAIAAADSIPPESWLYTFAQIEKSTVIARNRDDIDSAIRVLKDAIEGEAVVDPAVALRLQILLASDGRYDEAEAYAARAIRAAERLGVDDASMWRYYFARGASRLEAGRWEGAKQDLEKALDLAPEEPMVLNHLGYSYIERGEQLERAFGMIEAALARDPQNGAIVDSLGWAHFQEGNYQEAINHLEDAVALEPADAVITDHLGDAYYMVGRERDARFEWERVLTFEDADEELRATVRRKLDGDFSGMPVLSRAEKTR